MIHDCAHGEWWRRLSGKQPSAGQPPNERRFLRQLLGRLDDAGYGNVAHAILSSWVEVETRQRDRRELDALLILAMGLVSPVPVEAATRPGLSLVAAVPRAAE